MCARHPGPIGQGQVTSGEKRLTSPHSGRRSWLGLGLRHWGRLSSVPGSKPPALGPPTVRPVFSVGLGTVASVGPGTEAIRPGRRSPLYSPSGFGTAVSFGPGTQTVGIRPWRNPEHGIGAGNNGPTWSKQGFDAQCRLEPVLSKNVIVVLPCFP